jgi:predicted acylesterase/phospholipase RssA
MTATTGQPPGFSKADFVLEGGGVRGIAPVGALLAFEQRGVGWHRIAGVSAGAIVGSLVAAGIPLTALVVVVGVAALTRSSGRVGSD